MGTKPPAYLALRKQSFRMRNGHFQKNLNLQMKRWFISYFSSVIASLKFQVKNISRFHTTFSPPDNSAPFMKVFWNLDLTSPKKTWLLSKTSGAQQCYPVKRFEILMFQR